MKQKWDCWDLKPTCKRVASIFVDLFCCRYCIQFGICADGELVITAAFHIPTGRVAFLLIPLTLCDDSELDALLLNVMFGDNISTESPIKLLGLDEVILMEGSWLGVGADSAGQVFFTLDGVSIGSWSILENCDSSSLNAATFIPYFKNCPRYVLNFGQYDYTFEVGNRKWSPSKLVFPPPTT